MNFDRGCLRPGKLVAVPAPGDGVPGHPAHLVIEGGTSIPRGDLARVDVDVVNGRTLLSIPV